MKLLEPLVEKINSEDEKGRRIRRRAANNDYTVELGVFVDDHLFKYVKKRYPSNDEKHLRTKVTEIVMTLVNAVSFIGKIN